jgi:hypothetical protein
MGITYEQERTETERRIDAEVLERVKQGIAVLEEVHGPGWEDKIDLATLDLKDGAACVLGQVYAEKADASGGRYSNGFHYAIELAPGCVSSKTGFVAFTPSGWDALQECWEEVLEPRLRRRKT